MYEERKSNSGLRDLILQLLFILLFVFILCWLFPTKSYLNKRLEEVKVEENGNYSTQLDALTSQIFSNNIEKMKDAAQSYFTLSRLPQKEGETVKLTLKEMYDKNLLLEIKDKENKTCSADKSYVEVAKDKDEYVMKVNLSCGEEEAYILVHMGCYNYCSTTICAKQETVTKPSSNPTPTTKVEYQYKLTTPGKWGEYGAWSNWSTTKTTASDSKQVETKTVQEVDHYTTEYIIVGTSTVYADKVKSCLSGYVLTSDGTQCYNTVTVTPGTSSTTYNPTKTCQSGYVLSTDGSKCTKTENIGGTVTTDYKDYIYTCPTGYKETADKTKCYKTVTTEGTEKVVYAQYTGVCPAGYSNIGSKCRKTIISQVTTNSYLYDKEYTTTKADDGNYHYEFVSSRKAMSCTDACKVVNYYTYKVYQVVVDSKTSYDYKEFINKTCPTGYTLTEDGSQCFKTTKTAGVTNYEYKAIVKSCPTGYTDNGTSCYKQSITAGTTKTLTADYTLVCANGGSLSSDKTKCVISGTSATTKTVYSDYFTSCPVGYKENGTRCSKTVDKYDNVQVPVYKNVTYYRYRTRVYTSGSVDYKWSTSKNDTTLTKKGYVLTGTTR